MNLNKLGTYWDDVVSAWTSVLTWAKNNLIISLLCVTAFLMLLIWAVRAI